MYGRIVLLLDCDSKQYTYLKGEATLVAAPSNRAQHLELLTGQWVDVKFNAAIECASKETWACKQFHADEHAQLTAHWWEWLFTREDNASFCIAQNRERQ
jgi:hypothetical protein